MTLLIGIADIDVNVVIALEGYLGGKRKIC